MDGLYPKTTRCWPVHGAGRTPSNYRMALTKEQEIQELNFIRKEKQRIRNTNPEKEERKAFFRELQKKHPDLADAIKHQPRRKPRTW